jgi:protein-S-isoprenylcysteine O-methyltransferase Ste14
MRHLKYSDLGMYFAIFIVTVDLFFDTSDFIGKPVWILIMLFSGLLWAALAVYDNKTKTKYLKEITIPAKLIFINKIILEIFVLFFLLCIFYTFRWPLSSWMGYVYWLLLGAMITSRIMVSIDWQPKNIENK